MRKSLKAICIGLSLLNYNIFGQTIQELVPPDIYDEFVEKNTYQLIHKTGDNDYVLLPDCDFKQQCESKRVVKKAKKSFPFVAEILYKIDKKTLQEVNETAKDDFNISDVSKIMRSVSKMKDMTYFSTTRKKRLTLYKDAYTFESVENPVVIDDILEGSADGRVIYGVLDDASFGLCKYELHYFEKENILHAQFTNLDTMGLGFIKAIYPGDMIINIIVIDCGDCFLLYLGTDVNCVKFLGVAGQLKNSLVSRLDAIYNWFIHQF